MATTATAAGTKAWVMIAERLGVDTEALMREHGVTRELLDAPDGRVPYPFVLAVLQAAVRRPGGETIGLQVGALGQWGFVAEYAVRNSPTFGEALRRFARFARLVADSVEVTLDRDGDVARLGGTFATEQVPGLPAIVVRQGVDVWLSTVVTLGRNLTATAWSPREVHMTYPRPDDVAPYEALFRAPLLFEQPRSEVVLDAALLDLPVRGADTALGSFINRQCDEMLAKLPAARDESARVRKAIASALASGDVRCAAVARALGTSSRTLQRRLAEEGTSHQQLLDEVRRELSVRYLAERQLGIGEIAFLLGYSEPAAFHRAFKRWLGQSPAAFRRAR